MNFRQKSLKLAINPVFYNLPVDENNFNSFKTYLNNFIAHIKPDEKEEYNKNFIRDFVKNSLYPNFNVNISDYIDLAIYHKDEHNNKVAVIFEVKSPSNKNEMVEKDNFNKKAFYELVLYYLKEKITNNNDVVQKLIITNSIDWFMFDAHDFERVFARNSALVKEFENWQKGFFDSVSTYYFYSYIAPKYIQNSDATIDYVYFTFKPYINSISNNFTISLDDDFCYDLYKLLAPENLLKLPFANDSNSLNRPFYDELLYILGLHEVNRGTIIIERLPKEKRIKGSLIENTIEMLQKSIKNPDSYDEETIFEIALELVITWLNRILFLKLLESQIVAFHNLDKSKKFLTSNKIKEFDELNELFFDVLAIPLENRDDDINQQYPQVPYLNSSLFEKTDIELEYFSINELKDRYEIPYYHNTILVDEISKKKLEGKAKTLDYLLRFLEAYDFGNIGEKVRKQTNNIINAAVLGLIYEKINGYRDGSFFTPGQITMFMARQTIRRAICDIFSEHYQQEINDYEDLKNFLLKDFKKEKIKEYNEVFNKIKILDPACGSGHFLVSCLNELIATKSDLGILADKDGNRLEILARVENDELIISDHDGNLFTYKPANPKSAHIQKTIFHEKQTLIENCLFGVDINQKSVYITQLRLWIELLKHTYYKDPINLETLPNIDINIKVGDSLISRYKLHDKSSNPMKLSEIIPKYKEAVNKYKNLNQHKQNNQIKLIKLKEEIENYKSILSRDLVQSSELQFKLQKLLIEYNEKFQQEKIFNEKLTKKEEKLKKSLEEQIKKIQKQIEEETQSQQYTKAFEWRYEFPEVLDDNGNYIGFDIVIGNPPYIQLQKDGGRLANLYQKMKYQTFDRMGDIYVLFLERGMDLLRPNGYLCYITSNKWMRAGYGEALREFLATKSTPIQLIDFGGYKVFESATVDTNILITKKSPAQTQHAVSLQKQNQKSLPRRDTMHCVSTSLQNAHQFYACTVGSDFNSDASIADYFEQHKQLMPRMNKSAWIISSNIERKIKEKIEAIGTPLRNWGVKINYGIKTGFNEAFIIDGKKKDELIAQDPKSAEIIKPILRGRDIKRYKAEFADLWLINSHNGIKDKGIKRIDVVNDYPAIYNHLKRYEKELIKRQDKGDHWTNLRNCAYLEEFEKEKIVWAETDQNLNVVFVEKGIYLQKTCFMIIADVNTIKYLNAILNSTIMQYMIRQIASNLGKKGMSLTKEAVQLLPIPLIPPDQQLPFIELVDIILKKKEKNEDTTAEEREIDQLVYQLYGLTDEEIAIVEKNK